MYLGKVKKHCTAAVKQEWEHAKENCPADTQVREKEEGEGAAGAREEIPPAVPEQISTLH